MSLGETSELSLFSFFYRKWAGNFLVLKYPGIPMQDLIGFGSHGHVHQGWKRWKWWVFSGFPKWIVKVSSPKWSRILLRKLWANPLIELTAEMACQTSPDSKTGFWPDCARLPGGNRLFLEGFHGPYSEACGNRCRLASMRRKTVESSTGLHDRFAKGFRERKSKITCTKYSSSRKIQENPKTSTGNKGKSIHI